MISAPKQADIQAEQCNWFWDGLKETTKKMTWHYLRPHPSMWGDLWRKMVWISRRNWPNLTLNSANNSFPLWQSIYIEYLLIRQTAWSQIKDKVLQFKLTYSTVPTTCNHSAAISPVAVMWLALQRSAVQLIAYISHDIAWKMPKGWCESSHMLQTK